MDDLTKMSREELERWAKEDGPVAIAITRRNAAFDELASRLSEAEATLTSVRASLSAAEAIVEKLPKTADGKVPSPPCELWEVKRMGGMYVERHTCLGWVYDPKYRTFVVCPNMQEIPVSNLHSTREAAEAARTGGRA